MGRKHIFLPHAQTAIYDSDIKLFLKQGIFRQQPWSWLKGFVRYECDNSAIFTPGETHVNQYLPLMKHMLKGNFAIFYMLAKYVPGDIKYIFTKFYQHISTINEANRKFVILISNLFMGCDILAR